MRARLRHKLAKRKAFEKLRQLVAYIASEGHLSGISKNEAVLKARCLIFMCDMAVYEETGTPLLPGFRWIKRPDGPDLVWRGTR